MIESYTDAEAKADLYAGLLRNAGWKVSITIYRTPACRLGDGKVVAPGTVHAVMVAMRGYGEDALTLSWISVVDGDELTTRRQTAHTGRLLAEEKKELRTLTEVMAQLDQMLAA